MDQKRTFKIVILGLTMLLVTLPFVTTFNSVLTELVNRIGFYRTIQDTIVPLESRFVVFIVRLLGVPAYLANRGEAASFYLLKGKEYFPVLLQWNCLGWQSLFLLGISLFVGLQGNFSRSSMTQCILFGLIGTVLINIFRMVFITVGIYYVDAVFASLLHDYFAAFVTVIWLMFFWWFSYSFVLEQGSNPEVRK